MSDNSIALVATIAAAVSAWGAFRITRIEKRRHSSELARERQRERSTFDVAMLDGPSGDRHPTTGEVGAFRLHARVEVKGLGGTFYAGVSNVKGLDHDRVERDYLDWYAPSLAWREAASRGAKSSVISIGQHDFVMVCCLFAGPSRSVIFFHAANFDSEAGGLVEPLTIKGEAFEFDLRIVNHDTEVDYSWPVTVTWREGERPTCAPQKLSASSAVPSAHANTPQRNRSGPFPQPNM